MKHLSTLFFISLVSFSLATAQSSWYKRKGSRAFLGIHSNGISEEKAEILGFENKYGSYVTRVLGNTAAEEAGIQPFDYVIGVDEHRTEFIRSLTDILRKYDVGDQASVHFIRDGKAQSVSVTFGRSSDAKRKRNSNKNKDPFFGINQHSDNDDDELGVRVNVINNSSAEEMGLQDGDVITSINNHLIVDWSDISTAIDNMEVDQTINVRYQRDGKNLNSQTTIKSYAATRPSQSRSYYKSRSRSSYAFLGINSDQVSKEKARKLGFDNPYGSYVTNIVRGTAAEKAGIQPFDYIYGVDEYRVGEHQSLTKILRKFEPGDNAQVQVIRKKEKQSIPVTFGDRSDRRSNRRSNCDEPFFGIRNSHYASDEDGVGIEVVRNSSAEELGLDDGDIITSINGYPMFDWSDISTAIDNMKVGQTITVEYIRDGQSQRGSIPVKSHCDRNRNRNNRSYRDRISRLWNNDRSTDGEDIDMSKVNVTMDDLSENEANQMKEKYGVDMPVINNVRIDNLKLFPNPTMGMFRLQFELPEKAETIIKVYNAAGRLIYNYDLGSFSGEFSDEVDISQNGAGNYFLEVRQGRKSLTKKIVLQKS